MQTLGNIIFGAILASLSLGPAAWADVRVAFDTGISRAADMVAGTGKATLHTMARPGAAGQRVLSHLLPAPR